jgi:hypothetical protein
MQSVDLQPHRLLLTVDDDLCRRAVPEQVAALPGAGHVLFGECFDPRTEDRFVHALGLTVFGVTLRRGRPAARQQANHRLAACVHLPKCFRPPHPGTHTGLGIQIKVNLAGQPRLGLLEPALQRDRVTIVPARMT